MLLDDILLTVEMLSKFKSILSNPVTALLTKYMYCSKFFVVISMVFTSSSLGKILSQETTFFIHKKQLLIHWSFVTSCSIQLHL